MRHLLLAFLLLSLACAGCRSHSNPSATQSAATGYKQYALRGKVVSTNSSTGEVTLAHDAIPGFMEAMTMPYKLKDPSILSELHPGDVITADLFVSQGDDADVFIDHIVVVGQAKPDYKPAVQYHVPSPGDTVPDFKLRNQDGRSVRFAQFRGKTLLVTFIYTRCPLPNFCPLVTRNFANIERQLAASPALLNKTELLCISFDPDHDTPDRLRAYGLQYIGDSVKDPFAHWNFAVPEKPALAAMAQYFDVGLTTSADGQISHTLSTTLIGPDGKVVQFYPGNDWTPGQVLADLQKTVGS